MSSKLTRVPFPQGEARWAQAAYQAILELQGRVQDLEAEVAGGSISAVDGDAIHDNETGEIHAITAKTTPAAGDVFVMEDSAASYVKKRVVASDMPAGFLRSATTFVDTHSATAPTAGYALIATSTSAATWQSLSGKDTTAVHSGDSAGGSLGGTYPTSLTVTKINETGGPTALTIGSISDGFLTYRTGSTFVGLTRAGADTTAIHTGTSSEIHGITELTAVAQDDEYVVEDQSASYAKKRVQAKNNLAGYLASLSTQIDTKSSTAPSVGQVLTATNASTATWQTPGTIFNSGDFLGYYGMVADNPNGNTATFTTAPILMNFARELRACQGVSLGLNGAITFDVGSYFAVVNIDLRASAVSAAAHITWSRNGSFANTTTYATGMPGRIVTTSAAASGHPCAFGAPAFITTTTQLTLYPVVSTITAATWNFQTLSCSLVIMKTS